MSKIKLSRVDYRLIHGQVVTKWLKIASAKIIIIVDDVLAQDDFMGDIYKLSAPSGVKVNIVTCDSLVESYLNDSLPEENTMLLFKSINSVYKVVQGGVKLDSLQLGGVPKDKDNTMVFSAVSLNSKDVEELDFIADTGTKIEIQAVPDESAMSYADAKKKLK